MKLRSTERSAKILIDFADEYIFLGKKILDLGAGDGSLGKFIINQEDYYPVDIRQIDHPNWIEADFNNRAGWTRGLNHSLDPRDFDYVFASMILEHVFRPERLIKVIHRLLKKGGSLIVAVPDEDSFIYRIQAPFKRNKLIQEQYFGHHYSFTYRNAHTLLSEYFDIEKVAGRFGITSKHLIGIAPAVLFLCTK